MTFRSDQKGEHRGAVAAEDDESDCRLFTELVLWKQGRMMIITGIVFLQFFMVNIEAAVPRAGVIIL